jgi:hypothetical protein
MRASRLIPALLAVSALLVLAPAGATARPAQHKSNATAKGRCRLSLHVEPHTITAGEPVQLFGQLQCPGGGTEGQPVTIYERTGGLPIFKIISTQTTAAGGFYSLVVSTITTDAQFYARATGARSANKTVKVAPVVHLEGPPEKTPLLTGPKNKVLFKGTVVPADVGAEVVLQREAATSFEEWGVIQRGVVGAGGVFTFLHRFVAPGEANIRAVVRPHRPFTVRGVSVPLSYVINQTQNPNLTIESAADPIPYGTPTTIKGVLKGGSGQTITLLSRKKGAAKFTLFGTTVAGGAGEYKFVQVPLVNTFYRVTGAGQNSAILFEGVKYILTSGVSPKAIQSGQSITVSGTVTPAHAGKPVYLERENVFGGGFHVADVGTVGATGTYSIVHFVFGPGKPVFRVHVAGDPENQGVSSPVFTIDVAQAPLASLQPRPQEREPR